MYRRLVAIVAATIILLMVVPPLCNSFDKWDKGPELLLTGHDTETTLMMMAVEVGVGVAVAWSSVFLLAWLGAMLLVGMVETAPELAHRGIRATEYFLLLFSPPWRLVSLRI